MLLLLQELVLQSGSLENVHRRGRGRRRRRRRAVERAAPGALELSGQVGRQGGVLLLLLLLPDGVYLGGDGAGGEGEAGGLGEAGGAAPARSTPGHHGGFGASGSPRRSSEVLGDDLPGRRGRKQSGEEGGDRSH